MKLSRVVPLAMFATLLFGLSAEGMQISPLQSNPLRIGTIQNNPPYVIESPSSGIDMDTIRAAFAAVGREVEFIHAPLTRISSLLRSRRIDGITTLVGMGSQCTLSDVFSFWHDGVVIRQDLKRNISSIADLAGLRVGMFPSASAVFAEKLGPHAASFASETVINSTPSVLRLLQYGRIDAYIGDIWGLEALASRQSTSTGYPFRIALTFEPTPRYVCFLDSEVTEQFNTGVKELNAQGQLAKIVNLYRPQGN